MKMTVLVPANIGPLYISNKHFTATFIPKGKIYRPTVRNPIKWRQTGGQVYSARLLVGCNVNDKKVYDIEDFVNYVEPLVPAASFIAQRGIYTHNDGVQKVKEDSVQIVLIHTAVWHITSKQFIKFAEGLADKLAKDFQQDVVVLEIQRNGITKSIVGIGA